MKDIHVSIEYDESMDANVIHVVPEESGAIAEGLDEAFMAFGCYEEGENSFESIVTFDTALLIEFMKMWDFNVIVDSDNGEGYKEVPDWEDEA